MRQRPHEIQQLRLPRLWIELDRWLRGSARPRNSSRTSGSCSETERSPAGPRHGGGKHPRLLDAKAEIIAQQLQHRLKWRCPAVSQHACLEDADAFSSAIFGKLETQSALADAGLADDTDYAALALDRIFEFLRRAENSSVRPVSGLNRRPLRKTPLEGAC